MPSKEERVVTTETFQVGVDTGTLWLGDPGYIVSHASNNDHAKWLEMLGDDGGEWPLSKEKWDGFWFGTLYGDGTYDVTVEKNHVGQVLTIHLSFVEQDENDDGR